MKDLKFYLRYLQEHKNLLRTAVIIFIVIAAVLFFSMKGEDVEISENLSGQNEMIQTEIATDSSNQEDMGNLKKNIFVDIGGQVRKPGVYTMEDGARLFEVIEKAGGLTENAFTAQINQAELVSDGQKIWIPSKEEAETSGNQTEIPNASSPGGASAQPGDGKININTADSAALQEISGIGPATAEKIIAYRTENGAFQTIEDLKNVKGIGEKTFAKMKDKITV